MVFIRTRLYRLQKMPQVPEGRLRVQSCPNSGRLPGAGTYFVTSVTSQRRQLFQVAANAELFLETLQAYRHQGHYKLHALVVMPDHIHLLLTPLGETVERVMGLTKGGFYHRLASKGTAWQRGFSDHRIRDAEDFLTRRAYIRQNPVRARLVELPGSHSYSSAYRAEAAEPYLSG
jgi:putative transposase